MENKAVFNSRSSNRKEEHKNDHFVTPDWCVEVLGNYLFGMLSFIIMYKDINIYDFSCGKKSLSNKIKLNIDFISGHCDSFDINTLSSDLDNKVTYKTKFIDRVLEKEDSLEFILMNPPYSQKDLFIEKSLEFVNEVDNSLCALLLPTTTLNGKKRNEIYNRYKIPLHLLVLKSRPQFINGKSSNVDCSWFIWSKKFNEDKIVFV